MCELLREFDHLFKPLAIFYRKEGNNCCPNCTQSNWIVGRQSAECAFCQHVLPFKENDQPRGSKSNIAKRNGFRYSAIRGRFMINGRA